MKQATVPSVRESFPLGARVSVQDKIRVFGMPKELRVVGYREGSVLIETAGYGVISRSADALRLIAVAEGVEPSKGALGACAGVDWGSTEGVLEALDCVCERVGWGYHAQRGRRPDAQPLGESHGFGGLSVSVQSHHWGASVNTSAYPYAKGGAKQKGWTFRGASLRDACVRAINYVVEENGGVFG